MASPLSALQAITEAISVVESTLKPGRERSLAVTKLDEARFWASEAVAWE